jgi:hypothetical protein
VKPGRELDALVAEKVMGIEVDRAPWGELYVGKEGYDVVPAYSTDIAAAWEVVEKVTRETEKRFTLWQAPTYYVARFKHYDYWHEGCDSRQALQAKADTAPHAICLAALKAVGDLP